MRTGLVSRIANFARASPGELGLMAILGLAVVGGSALVLARTTDPPAPPIKRVAATTTATQQEILVVHVAGMVVSPGVYELPRGTRIKDALAAAGGPVEGADVNNLNLAELLTDGQKIVVTKPGEAPPSEETQAPAGKINLNTAAKAQLEELPGVGPVLAQRIIDYRQKKKFTSIRQLMEVDGFGPKKYESLKDLIAV